MRKTWIYKKKNLGYKLLMKTDRTYILVQNRRITKQQVALTTRLSHTSNFGFFIEGKLKYVQDTNTRSQHSCESSAIVPKSHIASSPIKNWEAIFVRGQAA